MNRLFIISRPCLWFAKTSIVTYPKMNEYYTAKAISSLESYGYIRRLSDIEIKQVDQSKIIDSPEIR